MLSAVPEPAESELEALRAALARTGLLADATPAAALSAWRRAGLAAATRRWPPDARYALPLRSTRGAARA